RDFHVTGVQTCALPISVWQSPGFTRFQYRFHTPVHDNSPQSKYPQQHILIQPAKFHEFPSLVTKPAGQLSQQTLWTHKNTDHGTSHHHKKKPEQYIDIPDLPRYFPLSHKRKEENGGSYPTGTDPEQRKLKVPAPAYRHRYGLLQIDTEKSGKTDKIMHRQDTREHLNTKKQNGHVKIFKGGSLRWRGLIR